MSKKVYIGAGHSNADPGATVGHLKEGELMTELRDLVAAEVRAAGAVAVTDNDDKGGTNLPLADSIDLAKTCDDGRRIELHLNAGPDAAKGVECLSLADQKTRAKAIAKAIGDTLQIRLRGDEGWKPDTEGQHSRLAFCRQADGIVVECFFLTNSSELASYKTHKSALAKAIADALLA